MLHTSTTGSEFTKLQLHAPRQFASLTNDRKSFKNVPPNAQNLDDLIHTYGFIAPVSSLVWAHFTGHWLKRLKSSLFPQSFIVLSVIVWQKTSFKDIFFIMFFKINFFYFQFSASQFT